jgi:hypothetical protein
MKFLKKVQSLPEEKRKSIFWIIMTIALVISFIFFIQRTKIKLKQSSGVSLEESLELPKIQGTINQMMDDFFKE